MRYIFLTFGCFVFSIFLRAQEVVIQGQLIGFNGKELKVKIIEDYITNKKSEVARVRVEEGKFKLSLQLDHTQQLFIRIEDKETSLFIEPGSVYNLNISYDAALNEGKAFDKFLNLSFPFPQAGELNQEIKKFNLAYQDFFSQYYQRIILKGGKKEIEEFVAEWSQYAANKEPQYLKSYIIYSLAYLEDISGVSKNDLFLKHLNKKEILYSNKEYMNFFNQLYQKDFEQYTLTKKGTDLLKAMMVEKSLDKTVKLIQEYKNFDDVAFAELYLVKGLFEVYHTKRVNQKDAISLLKEISDKGKNSENKTLANNVIQNLLQFDQNGLAPEFTLTDEKGEKVSLSDFRGKKVYLGYWADWSIPSLRELRVLKVMHEKYGDKIHFVSINVDDDLNKMKSAKAKNGYTWTFLHQGENYDLKERYGVRAIPSYFLIDEMGKLEKAFLQSPALFEKDLLKHLE